MAPALAAVGLFLCFWGGKSVKPALMFAALVVGFTLGHYAGSLFDKPEAPWIVAVIGALSFVALAVLAFSTGLFVIGALGGGVLFRVVETSLSGRLDVPDWAIIAAVAGGGFITLWLQKRVLAVITALVGGFMVVEAAVRIADGQFLYWEKDPQWAQPLYKNIAWFIMSFTGMMVQQHGRRRKENE